MELIYIVILGGIRVTKWDMRRAREAVAFQRQGALFANALVFPHLSGIYLYPPACALAVAFCDSHSIYCAVEGGASPTQERGCREGLVTDEDRHLTVPKERNITSYRAKYSKDLKHKTT